MGDDGMVETVMLVNLTTVDGFSALTSIVKAASDAGCAGHYDGDLSKVVMESGPHEFRATVLPSPGFLRFLADKIDKLS